LWIPYSSMSAGMVLLCLQLLLQLIARINGLMHKNEISEVRA